LSVTSTTSLKRGKIPQATIARLPIYYRALSQLFDRGERGVSSEELAEITGVTSAKLRKDLSHLGTYGTRGVGYEVEYLKFQIAREMGLNNDWSVVIVGLGNLGRALARYGGFGSRGFKIVGLFDHDPKLIGSKIKTGVTEVEVFSAQEISKTVKQLKAKLGVIAVPAEVAQQVCDDLVSAGVTSILNFAPTHLATPIGVDVRRVDLASELQILAFHEQKKNEAKTA
jgi:redox-sensing transcriptional repressor